MKKIKINLKELGFPAAYYLSMIVLSFGLLLIVTSFALESFISSPVLLSILSLSGLVFFGVGIIFVILNRKKVIQYHIKLNYHKEMRNQLSFHEQKESIDSIRKRMTDRNFMYVRNHLLYNKVFTLSKVYMQYFIALNETDDADIAIRDFMKQLNSVDEFAKNVIKNPNKCMVLILYMKNPTHYDLSMVKMRIESAVAMQSDYRHPSITFIPIIYDVNKGGFIYRDVKHISRHNNFRMGMKHLKQLLFTSNTHSFLQFYDSETNDNTDREDIQKNISVS